MRRLLTSLLLTAALTTAGAAVAGAPPAYDESADAKLVLKQTLGAAKVAQVPVLILFGANWCEDCRALDRAMTTGRNGELIAREFRVVKIDIGRFDRNMDIAAVYGNPVRKGIPAAVVLASDSHEVLYATRAGELADARRMSETGIHDFFRNIVQQARGKK